mgnify:FL=1
MPGFASLTFYSATRLFMQDWRKSVPKVIQNMHGIYMISKMLISLIPEYLSYYKADFHPDEIDYSKIVTYWKEKLADEYGMESFQEETHPVLYS